MSRASCCGFFASFVETAFGRGVVVTVPVDPVVVADPAAVVPPAVAVVPDVAPDVAAATGLPFDFAPAEELRPLDAVVVVVVVLVEVGAVLVFAGAP